MTVRCFRSATLIAMSAGLCLLLGLGCRSESGNASDAQPGQDGGVADAGVRDATALLDASCPAPPSCNGDAGATGGDERHPVLSNFRVEADFPDRIFFDSSEPITVSSNTGFIISDRTVGRIVYQPCRKTGHYLAIDVAADKGGPYTFWDNTTIRYEGGSDLRDLHCNALHEFTLQYVVNNIKEPPRSTEKYRYVTAEAGANGDGSRNNPWNLQRAGSNAEPGDTVWIKAGDYGDKPLVVARSGTSDHPIRFIGYRETSDGKLDEKPRLEPIDQDTELDPLKMPYIHKDALCTDPSCRGVDFGGKHFIMIRNLQIEGYYSSLYGVGDASDCLVENVYAKGPSCYGLNFNDGDTQRVRLKDCYVSNAGEGYTTTTCGVGVFIAGDHNLIEHAYISSRVHGTTKPDMDYYIALYGHKTLNGPGTGNIIRNSTIARDPDDSHTGHGISLKAGNVAYALEQNLVERCTIWDVAQAIEFRHHGTRFNVAREVTARTKLAAPTESNLVTFRDGTSDNTVESCLADHVYRAILFNETTEDGAEPQAGGLRNKVINTVFQNCTYNIMVHHLDDMPTLESQDNEFLNCTFYGATYMFALLIDAVGFGRTNHFRNCSIVNVRNEFPTNTVAPAPEYTSCDFSWQAGGWDVPEGNFSLEPGFVNAAGGDFHLTTSSLIRNRGTDLANVHYDKDGEERTPGHYSIGAYECNAAGACVDEAASHLNLR